MKNTLFVLLGPTGVGKTDLSIEIAKHLHTEIISCDSRQLYREIRIGTAVPEEKYLQQVPHHMIQNLSVEDEYNAGKFEYDVLNLLDKLFQNHQTVLMTGGSMLYIDAVCKGIDDLPTVDKELRQKLLDRFENEGLEPLRTELKKLDPDYYEQVDLKNPKRILHALEIYYMTGKPYSSLRREEAKKRHFDIIKIGLNRDRTELYDQINRRVELMIEEGLVEEARGVYYKRHLNPLNTVGYKELFAHFDGDFTLEHAIERIQANSRKYARKQLTWFRRDKNIRWFHPDEKEKVLQYIDEQLSQNEKA
ncbi:tRNA (adenosine(37)-N6)-dimethylallyltransferase MiaA [Prolixibacter denitrificans]|uniref:tRNA dimethylallyltransferase n=1 Tax=Prolixibacter denitrificans TaxID=1541063 RepID=A0A2P8CJJ9_9BACT|nr:tRNA (adenosine(37)-N6)-dimethylallyltransferase MiaA [Prolixibacter denitrificans]PSK85113.1 tRNA dimethylallyltransferase [Prolixibacter denitrificans]GET23655.1 tRNA dimethylallyltransferase 1 [Prolixibacter denitrificans]